MPVSAFKARFMRSVKNFVRRVCFCFFDVSGNFALNSQIFLRSKFFTLKILLKETKIRSAYEIFYTGYKQGFKDACQPEEKAFY